MPLPHNSLRDDDSPRRTQPARVRDLAQRRWRPCRRSGPGDAVPERAIANIDLVPTRFNLPAWLFTICATCSAPTTQAATAWWKTPRAVTQDLKTPAGAERASGVRGVSRSARQAAAGPAREAFVPVAPPASPMRMRRRSAPAARSDHQEPRQPRAREAERTALCRRRRGLGPDDTVRAVIGGNGG